MDEKNYDFRIIVINENIEIQRDFLKILTKNSNIGFEAFKPNFICSKSESTKSLILPRFKIDSAIQSKEGLALIEHALEEKEPYALAFVDLCMPPEGDGIETVKAIWAIDPDIHVVICTSFSDYSLEKALQDLGHRDNFLLLKKPFDHIAVRQLAYALTRKWKMLREARIYTKSFEQAVEKRTEELKIQATHDALTGLANRVLLKDRIEQAIAAYKRHKIGFAVLFIDLDRFKLVNDSLGHAAGDELLKIISKRLMPSTRGIDTFARVGGDEFVILLTELKNFNFIKIRASKILNIVKEPIELANHLINMSCSLGIAIYPQDGNEVDSLLRNADTAMYHAKNLGGDQYQYYSREMNKKVLAQIELESQLYQALSNHELELWYQPEFNVKSQKLEAVEALLRWNHPQKGLLLPINFIPIAEQTGLIIPIGEWVIREACQQNKIWQESGLPPIRVAVNVTSQQLTQFDFVAKVEKILKDLKLEPQYLELELSESALINNTIIDRINGLKNLGIEIALDDFGTGYSNLFHLRQLSIDRLKIDQSFINNIQSNHDDEVIIHAIIAMAQSLNLEVLAEGVETQKQLDFLKGHDCDRIQGFYFSEPLPVSSISSVLKDPNHIFNV